MEAPNLTASSSLPNINQHLPKAEAQSDKIFSSYLLYLICGFYFVFLLAHYLVSVTQICHNRQKKTHFTLLVGAQLIILIGNVISFFEMFTFDPEKTSYGYLSLDYFLFIKIIFFIFYNFLQVQVREWYGYACFYILLYFSGIVDLLMSMCWDFESFNCPYRLIPFHFIAICFFLFMAKKLLQKIQPFYQKFFNLRAMLL